MSLSRWVAEVLRARASSDWSPEVRASFGTWVDFPELEALRSDQGTDLPRDPL
jgi:hypothetical protein